jgi:hypothetical protein
LFVVAVDTVVSSNGVHTDRPDGSVPSADGGRSRSDEQASDDADRADGTDRTNPADPGAVGADRDADAELAELRATVDGLEAELERAEAEKRELIDRYERLLAVERRGREGAERDGRSRATARRRRITGVRDALRLAVDRLRSRLRQ